MRNLKIEKLIEKYPFVEVFFGENNFDISNSKDLSFAEYLHSFSEEEKEELAINEELLCDSLEIYINQMKSFLGLEDDEVNSITLLAGTDKFGNRENYDEFKINKSEIVSKLLR